VPVAPGPGMSEGITLVDTGFGERPAFCAAWLVVEGGRAAIIDCGTLHSVPRMLAALDAAGVPRDAVDHLVATHVHLDHAGGAGGASARRPASGGPGQARRERAPGLWRRAVRAGLRGAGPGAARARARSRRWRCAGAGWPAAAAGAYARPRAAPSVGVGRAQ